MDVLFYVVVWKEVDGILLWKKKGMDGSHVDFRGFDILPFKRCFDLILTFMKDLKV